jgi:triosephosphate isomerase
MTAGKLIVGNWKMNGLMADSRERAQKLATAVNSHKPMGFQMVVCPPTTMMGIVAATLKGSDIRWGGQDCHSQQSGAFTGDISAEMLGDQGCSYIIVGHSERRQHHKETSAQVAAKAQAVHAAGLVAIICVGELDHERTAGQADRVVSEQLKASIPNTSTPQNTVIAYEPVWAIGTGKTASSEDIRQMHALIRGQVNALPILYGGSVKAANAAEILHIPHVDGVLVGGASLKAEEFLAIAQASQ